MRSVVQSVCVAAIVVLAASAGAAETPPPWAEAHRRKPMTAEETRAFMKELAQFVFDNHLKKAPESPQRGMVYEYFAVARKGQFDQFVQGEGLDTMHDGAWLAAAMVSAHRATGDPFYRQFLAQWQMPFYCKMLNHSDSLFDADRNDAREGAKPWGKPWKLQQGEKGFVPYFWDDGGSVSLERLLHKKPLGIRPCADFLAGKPNPRFLLNGYSLGMSNHMAQDLGVMVQLAWLLFKDSDDAAGKKLAAEIAEAARNLHECRVRHWGHIPMCVAPAALANADAALMRRVPDPASPRLWRITNHYSRALYDFKPGQRMPFPCFADDQQYRYYYGIARSGGTLTKALAFRVIYDAYTEPMLYRYYCDDLPAPPGVNRFDLYVYYVQDGKPTDYRSDRKGPHASPKPIGSRMGPQNMICCGWALQALRLYPGIWEERCKTHAAKDLRVYIDDPPPTAKAWETPIVQATLGGVTLELVAKRSAFQMLAKPETLPVTIKLFSRPDAQGAFAAITIGKDKTVAAVNDKGEPLKIRTKAVPGKDGAFAVSIVLPYTVAKGQKPWANGVEHGRYSLQIGAETRNLTLASSEAQVRAWLQHELAGGLRTWQAIFRHKGFIPTGIGTRRHWDGYSDSGGYAHLISAAAQWLLLLADQRDWEIHNIPTVLKAK
jgi:hypothetical protein